ncbi:MAG: threonine synthase [Candidatus Nephrothrix sp. EaCA]|nr:MAG: threonine synthase [Candidatus Nephrothrix sp. EaCA]
MLYYSTHNKLHTASLREAVLRGLAPDGGLYMPEEIPVFPPAFFKTLPELSFKEMAFRTASAFLKNDLPETELRRMTENTITFDVPCVPVEKDIFALELFHGPTLAFKDFGARFMSQLLGYFASQQSQEIVILAATSGDTGSAVANGFLGVAGTRVIVLYPSGKVSPLQEKQFTALGKNITAIEIDGVFDDCQRLVKEAFGDKELNKSHFLTSANSINIARLIPQSFYYFYGWSRLPKRNHVAVSVPSGNFGNLTAGLIAKRMGLPIEHFVASTNINDPVPQFLATKKFAAKNSVATISNAMDVGNPSNFARILDLYKNDYEALCADVTGYSFSDEDTRTAMKTVYASGYTLDPHGAVGYNGLKRYLSGNQTGLFLETAHPAKFREVVEATLRQPLIVPPALLKFLKQEKHSILCKKDFNSFKSLLEDLL